MGPVMDANFTSFGKPHSRVICVRKMKSREFVTMSSDKILEINEKYLGLKGGERRVQERLTRYPLSSLPAVGMLP